MFLKYAWKAYFRIFTSLIKLTIKLLSYLYKTIYKRNQITSSTKTFQRCKEDFYTAHQLLLSTLFTFRKISLHKVTFCHF